MAAFNHIRDMYDVALRPRLLRSILREYIPDDKHPFGSPSSLSKVLYLVKTHNLLSESFREPTNPKQIDNWRAAVDSWVERLIHLVSSDMPDKCWAGICLLGVTCQECCSDRFLASYQVWFQKLLAHIQSPTASHFVKIASCSSIADLLARLSGFPNVKRDGTAHVGKLIQPVLRLINDDKSEAVWEGAVHLLCTIMTFFPFSISRHYDLAEAAIASKIFSGSCSLDILKKLAHCLALLPKTRGDEESWSLMMQKILLWINDHLNEAFQGFEEETKSSEAIRLLLPPGKDPPPPLRGVVLSGEALHGDRRMPEYSLMSSVSTLMLCCCMMLTTSYPVQVVVPVRSLQALVERVLLVDGSLPNSMRPFMTVMQQEFISSELPVLHLHSLELLAAIIKGLRSQLLPHAASILRLISVYFKRCALPELRTKIYTIAKILLFSMGVGMAMSLAREVVDNAFVDLNPNGNESGDTSASVKSRPSAEAPLRPSHRKRKHAATTGSFEEWHDKSNSELGALKNHSPTLFTLRIAALEALEALLTMGGALRSDGWRSDLDCLLINIATDSLKEGWANEERSIFQHKESTEIWVDLQIAALRALLASFLSSSHIRPPYLAQGLELFHRGRQETGTKLAEFCAHALLALEVLIHPRALPLEDFPTSNRICDGFGSRFPENMYSGGLKHSIPFSSEMTHNASEPDHDDLYDSWLGDGKETEAPASDPANTREYNDETPETATVCRDENISFGDPVNQDIPNGSEQELQTTCVDSEKRGNRDEIMVESHRFQEPTGQFQNSVSTKVASIAAATDSSGSVRNNNSLFEKVTSDGLSKQDGTAMASGHNVLVPQNSEYATVDKDISTTSIDDKSKNIVSSMEDESDSDKFPDIVDADPDSDAVDGDADSDY